VHDPRIGRFLSIDPLAPDYPHNSPYAFSENSVVAYIELEGLEKIKPLNQNAPKREFVSEERATRHFKLYPNGDPNKIKAFKVLPLDAARNKHGTGWYLESPSIETKIEMQLGPVTRETSLQTGVGWMDIELADGGEVDERFKAIVAANRIKRIEVSGPVSPEGAQMIANYLRQNGMDSNAYDYDYFGDDGTYNPEGSEGFSFQLEVFYDITVLELVPVEVEYETYGEEAIVGDDG